MICMKGKKILVMGLANNHSLAWGIAQSINNAGGECLFTYHPVMQKRVESLAHELGSTFCFPCDVSQYQDIDKLFETLSKEGITLDGIVHAIAFTDKNELRGKYYETTCENFLNTMSVSCYSLTRICYHASKHMNAGGSIVTLTYHGARKVMPNYNVMGVAKAALESSIQYLAVDLGDKNIRINGVSAGPVRTLASAGIGDFRYILKWNQYNAPLKRNTTIEEVGDTTVFLLSNLARGITGDILYVDSGYHVIGMKAIDAPDISVVD